MDSLILKEKVLESLKLKGPQLPVHMAAQLKINLTFAGAFLSELISEKKARCTTLKVGGSPLYYVPGHEIKLQSFSKYLGQREKEAYDVLMQEKLMRDDELQPVIRVAMRAIKDFAVALKITTEKEAAIYWKWYLLQEEELHTLLETKLNAKEQLIPISENILQPTTLSQQSPLQVAVPEKKVITSHIKKEVPETIEDAKEEQSLQNTNVIKKEDVEEKDFFAKELFAYFSSKNIIVLSYTIEKKNKEIECVIKLPTPLGEISYLCVAKKKKRCSDADLSAGYIKATTRKMPFLFVSASELPKKVHEFVAMHMPNTLVRTLNGNKNI